MSDVMLSKPVKAEGEPPIKNDPGFSCSCLTKIVSLLESRYGLGNYRVSLKMGIDTNTYENFSTIPPLEYQYRAKNKQGKVVKKWLKGFLVGAYCPFCGTLRKESSPEPIPAPILQNPVHPV